MLHLNGVLCKSYTGFFHLLGGMLDFSGGDNMGENRTGFRRKW